MPSSPTHSRAVSASILSEQIVQEGFHGYLRLSLTQAKVEKLLDEDVLSSAESDLMITGPALCLYFAALRCTTDPPSVPLPRTVKVTDGRVSPNTLPPLDLSYENCPPAFSSFLRVWASCVPQIQSLQPEQQHDLARIICNLPAISDPVYPEVIGISADLRAVAIEISQRRSFQDRYAEALQAALDAGQGAGTPSPKRAAFVPPPAYEESTTDATPTSPQASPRISLDVPRPLTPPHNASTSPSHLSPTFQAVRPSSPLSPLSPLGSQQRPSSRPVSPSPNTTPALPPRPSTSSGVATSSSTTTRPRPPPASAKLSISHPDSPAIVFIRETLYAALADTIATHPALTKTLRTNPPRAYFSATSLAILNVARTCIVHIPDTKVPVPSPTNTSTTLTSSTIPGLPIPIALANYAIRGVGSRLFGLSECPDDLRPFMAELISIGLEAERMEEEDTLAVVKALQEGKEGEDVDVMEPRMERVVRILEGGIGAGGEEEVGASTGVAPSGKSSSSAKAKTSNAGTTGNVKPTTTSSSPFSSLSSSSTLSKVMTATSISELGSALDTMLSSCSILGGTNNILHASHSQSQSSSSSHASRPSQSKSSHTPHASQSQSSRPTQLDKDKDKERHNVLHKDRHRDEDGDRLPKYRAQPNTTITPYDFKPLPGTPSAMPGSFPNANAPTNSNSNINSNAAKAQPNPPPLPTKDNPTTTRTPSLQRQPTERTRKRSIEGRAVAFANRVNTLSLHLTRLRAFKDRQGDVFKVLMGVVG